MDRKSITKLVIEEANKKNMGTKELSERSGLSTRYINYLKKGEQTILSIDIADRLLKALELSVTIGAKPIK